MRWIVLIGAPLVILLMAGDGLLAFFAWDIFIAIRDIVIIALFGWAFVYQLKKKRAEEHQGFTPFS
jgi:hypothetical protein